MVPLAMEVEGQAGSYGLRFNGFPRLSIPIRVHTAFCRAVNIGHAAAWSGTSRVAHLRLMSTSGIRHNNNDNNYTFLVRRPGVHLDHLDRTR
jgi:hypothetical protein